MGEELRKLAARVVRLGRRCLRGRLSGRHCLSYNDVLGHDRLRCDGIERSGRRSGFGRL
jgi:hypothetical protein